MGKGYQDPEFGRIDDDVRQIAAALWENGGRHFTHRTLRDEGAGWRLMLKAAALTTRKRAEQKEHIKNLYAYLLKVYKRQVLAELEKENGHRRCEAGLGAGSIFFRDALVEDIERKILVQQLIRRMDEWTRLVFELLQLGHSFEEIARNRETKANVVRSKYSKSLMRLKRQLEDETGADE